MDGGDGGDPEAGGNDAEAEVLENKGKKALIDCLSHGRAKWPDDGITTSHMYAVIGLVILMGLQPFAEIRCHWDTRVMYDFPHVRECMTRNFFLLIYCRYIHMASKQDRTPSDDGYDILHHIRYGVLISDGRDFLGERHVHCFRITVFRMHIFIIHHASIYCDGLHHCFMSGD